MSAQGSSTTGTSYILPARVLRGTPDEILAELDELIQGLIGLRWIISAQRAEPQATPQRLLRVVRRAAHRLVALAMLALAVPAAARADVGSPPETLGPAPSGQALSSPSSASGAA